MKPSCPKSPQSGRVYYTVVVVADTGRDSQDLLVSGDPRPHSRLCEGMVGRGHNMSLAYTVQEGNMVYTVYQMFCLRSGQIYTDSSVDGLRLHFVKYLHVCRVHKVAGCHLRRWFLSSWTGRYKLLVRFHWPIRTYRSLLIIRSINMSGYSWYVSVSLEMSVLQHCIKVVDSCTFVPNSQYGEPLNLSRVICNSSRTMWFLILDFDWTRYWILNIFSTA